MNIDILAIIPARSGSKGIPDKNIKKLGNIPLLGWTANAVKSANLENMLTILSTDSEQYADIGRELGLNVPFIRPMHYSEDHSGTLEVIHHALDWFYQSYHYKPKMLMVLQPTSPFRDKTVITQAVQLIKDKNADAIIGCKQIFRDLTTLFICKNQYLSALDNSKDKQTSRQGLEPLLTPDGSMYLIKTKIFEKHNSFYPPHSAPLITSKLTNIDIDDDEDWQIAEGIVNNGQLETN